VRDITPRVRLSFNVSFWPTTNRTNTPGNGHRAAGLRAVVTVGLALGLRYRKRLQHHIGVPVGARDAATI